MNTSIEERLKIYTRHRPIIMIEGRHEEGRPAYAECNCGWRYPPTGKLDTEAVTDGANAHRTAVHA